MVIIGGVGSVPGVVLGAILVYGLQQFFLLGANEFGWFANAQFGGLNAVVLSAFIYGAAIVVVVLFEPGGAAAIGRRILARPPVDPQLPLPGGTTMILRRHVVAAGALASALLLAACGSTADAPAGGADAGAGGLRTDTGVTDTTITLGVMGDTSGPFKNLGAGLNAGNQLWADDVNAAGGICNRQVELEIVDHGYKADTAKTLYPQLEPKVLGMLQLLGSPVLAALKQNLIDDKLTAAPASWSSEVLDNPYIMMIGTTYDLEIIDGLAYLQQQGLLADGDTIGHIYIDGEYGANGLRGSQYYATQHNLTVREAKITSTDSDLTNIVTGFRGEGVKVIVLTTTPAQTASAMSANQALGLNVPVLGNNPVFDPALLAEPGRRRARQPLRGGVRRAVLREDPQGRRGGRQVRAAVPGLAEERRRALRLRGRARLAGRAGEGLRERRHDPRWRPDRAAVADVGEHRGPGRGPRLQLARLAAHPQRVHREGRPERRGRAAPRWRRCSPPRTPRATRRRTSGPDARAGVPVRGRSGASRRYDRPGVGGRVESMEARTPRTRPPASPPDSDGAAVRAVADDGGARACRPPEVPAAPQPHRPHARRGLRRARREHRRGRGRDPHRPGDAHRARLRRRASSSTPRSGCWRRRRTSRDDRRSVLVGGASDLPALLGVAEGLVADQRAEHARRARPG